MPRNGTGNYTIPSPAFVSGTKIASSPMNANFSDIAAALTDSVAADGQTTMTGPLKAPNGTAAAPGVTFAGDNTTGIYLSSAGNLAITTNGTQAAIVNASQAWTFPGNVTINGTLSTSFSSLNVTGNGTIGGTLGVTGAATFSSSIAANSASLTTPLPASSGGTGASTLTANNVVLGNGTSAVAFAAPSALGQLLTDKGAGSNPSFSGPVMFAASEQQTSGTASSTNLSGSTWTTVVLNTTLLSGISGVSLSGNALQSVPAGNYLVWATVPGPLGSNGTFQARVFDSTHSAVLVTGSSNIATSAVNAEAAPSVCFGYFTLSATSNIVLQGFTNGSGAVGHAVSGGTETYSQIMLWKVG